MKKSARLGISTPIAPMHSPGSESAVPVAGLQGRDPRRSKATPSKRDCNHSPPAWVAGGNRHLRNAVRRTRAPLFVPTDQAASSPSLYSPCFVARRSSAFTRELSAELANNLSKAATSSTSSMVTPRRRRTPWQ